MTRATVSLREAHAEATRTRIVDAMTALVSEGHPAALSVPAVARRAGVSVATVYRSFPTKDQLLDAAAEVGDLLPVVDDVEPPRLDELDGFLAEQFRHLADLLPLLHAQLASPAGREMRARRLPRHRALAAALARAGVDADTAKGERLVRLAVLLSSSVALVELHERQGGSVDQTAEDVAWALRSLVEATRAEQDRGGAAGRGGDTTSSTTTITEGER